MKISVIPWHVFIEALLQQEPSTVELWLRRWLFTNEGVIIAHEKLPQIIERLHARHLFQ